MPGVVLVTVEAVIWVCPANSLAVPTTSTPSPRLSVASSKVGVKTKIASDAPSVWSHGVGRLHVEAVEAAGGVLRRHDTGGGDGLVEVRRGVGVGALDLGDRTGERAGVRGDARARLRRRHRQREVGSVVVGVGAVGRRPVGALGRGRGGSRRGLVARGAGGTRVESDHVDHAIGPGQVTSGRERSCVVEEQHLATGRRHADRRRCHAVGRGESGACAAHRAHPHQVVRACGERAAQAHRPAPAAGRGPVGDVLAEEVDRPGSRVVELDEVGVVGGHRVGVAACAEDLADDEVGAAGVRLGGGRRDDGDRRGRQGSARQDGRGAWGMWTFVSFTLENRSFTAGQESARLRRRGRGREQVWAGSP